MSAYCRIVATELGDFRSKADIEKVY